MKCPICHVPTYVVEFEQIELDAGSDVVTRGQASHTGTISELHLNLQYYRQQNRGMCIKMNPTIPGKTPWACLYLSVDPLLFPILGVNGGPSTRGDYFNWMGKEQISRLLHDAFISKKRCTIVFFDASSTGKHNIIGIVSCFN